MKGLRIVLIAQALRAFAYGFGAVLLGLILEERHWSGARIGVVLTAIVAGSALASYCVGRFGEQLGKRRTYFVLFIGMSITGTVFAFSENFWALVLASLLGTLSTDVIESGPFTSVEQAMIPALVETERRTSAFGTYNAVAAVAGSLGSLAAGGPQLLRNILPGGAPQDARFFLVFVLVGLAGMALATRIGEEVEVKRGEGPPDRKRLHRSRGNVIWLSSLFAVDSLAGGFIVQSFIVFWFRRKFGLPVEVLGTIFFAIGLLQALSFMLATRLARIVGLLNTMVFTHLPSNLLLAAIPFAPTPTLAVALLLVRFGLSQMDVPTRQAYIVTLVDPEERTAAAAFTNTARTAVRPLGPALAGISQQFAAGLPFLIAGSLKAAYDLVLWTRFRKIPLSDTKH